MIEFLCFVCAILFVSVIILCVKLKKTTDSTSTLQSEVNFIFKNIKEIEGKIDVMNKETLRILSEKVLELEDRLLTTR